MSVIVETKYICPICKARYDETVSAENCEKSHPTDFTIDGLRYEEGYKFPTHILIRSGNVCKSYYLDM